MILLGFTLIPGMAGFAQGSAAADVRLLAHWRFEEGTGLTTTDTQGKYPGTLSTGVSFTNAGIAGSALSLNAAQGGAVNFGDILPLTNTAFTISVWFKTPSGDLTPEAALVGRHRPWYENGYFLILNAGIGTLMGFGGVGAFPATPTPVNDGAWHHAALVTDGVGNARLHLDGGAPVGTAKGGPIAPSPADFMIGGIDPPPPARRFNGLLDEVQVYGTALDQDSIDFLFTHPGRSLAEREVISFSPEAGPVSNPTRVTLSTTVVLGQIRYTTDGSEPTTTSTLYSGPFFLPVTGPVTVRARVFINGFPASEIRSVSFEPDPGIRLVPSEPLFTNQVSVTIASSLPGVSLRYTTDGIDPTATSTPYTTPIVLTNATVVRARAFLNGFPVTEVIARRYLRVYAFDHDGIAPAWRRQHFGDEFLTDPRAAAEADPDGDGSNNRQEFLANTDPLDPRSGLVLRVRAVPELRFAAVPGEKYRILRRAFVDDPSPAVLTEITASDSEIVYVDQEAGVTANAAFYLIAPVP